MGRFSVVAFFVILFLGIPSSAVVKADEGTIKEILLSGEDLVEKFYAFLRRCEDSNYDRGKKGLPPIDFSADIIKTRTQTASQLRFLMNKVNAMRSGTPKAHIEIGRKVLANYLSCLKLHEVLVSGVRGNGKNLKPLLAPTIISAHPATVSEGKIEKLIEASIASKTEDSLKLIDSLP